MELLLDVLAREHLYLPATDSTPSVDDDAVLDCFAAMGQPVDERGPAPRLRRTASPHSRRHPHPRRSRRPAGGVRIARPPGLGEPCRRTASCGPACTGPRCRRSRRPASRASDSLTAIKCCTPRWRRKARWRIGLIRTGWPCSRTPSNCKSTACCLRTNVARAQAVARASRKGIPRANAKTLPAATLERVELRANELADDPILAMRLRRLRRPHASSGPERPIRATACLAPRHDRGPPRAGCPPGAQALRDVGRGAGRETDTDARRRPSPRGRVGIRQPSRRRGFRRCRRTRRGRW